MKSALNKLKRSDRRSKKQHYRQILNLVTGLLILFLLLCFEPFSQITMSVTMQLRPVSVFAEYSCDIFFVDLVIGDGTPLTERRKER